MVTKFIHDLIAGASPIAMLFPVIVKFTISVTEIIEVPDNAVFISIERDPFVTWFTLRFCAFIIPILENNIKRAIKNLRVIAFICIIYLILNY